MNRNKKQKFGPLAPHPLSKLEKNHDAVGWIYLSLIVLALFAIVLIGFGSLNFDYCEWLSWYSDSRYLQARCRQFVNLSFILSVGIPIVFLQLLIYNLRERDDDVK